MADDLGLDWDEPCAPCQGSGEVLARRLVGRNPGNGLPITVNEPMRCAHCLGTGVDPVIPAGLFK